VRLAERIELALHQMQQRCERDAGAPDGAVLGTIRVVSGDPRGCVAELQRGAVLGTFGVVLGDPRGCVAELQRGAVLGTIGVVSGDPRGCVAELQWV
jgi:hypothetical protein